MLQNEFLNAFTLLRIFCKTKNAWPIDSLQLLLGINYKQLKYIDLTRM